MAKTPMQSLREEISKEFVHAINSGSKLGMSIIIGLIRNKYEEREREYMKDLCISFAKYLDGVKIESPSTKDKYDSDFNNFVELINKKNETSKTNDTPSQ